MLATFTVERTLLQWQDFLPAVLAWIGDAGVFAIAALIMLGVYYLLMRFTNLNVEGAAFEATRRVTFVRYAIIIAVYVLSGAYLLGVLLEKWAGGYGGPGVIRDAFQTIAGGLALAVLIGPLVRDFLFKFRWGRIWALAILSIKEARSRGVLWLCAIIPLIFLYADYFFHPKPEDQLRNRISVVYFALTLLFFVTAVVLGSFSIPNDVRNQTIHTIVTKPVERYEIVLGRFFGYALLLFVEMALLSTLSLIYVVRGVTPEAAAESFHARVPLYAEYLNFIGTRSADRGESVGSEWEYRSYIGGTAIQAKKQYAFWTFLTLPGHLASRTEDVPLEFTFDIFRTTTGEVGKGVFCAFTFARGGLSLQEIDSLLNAMRKERDEKHALFVTRAGGKKLDAQARAELKKIDGELAHKYGVFVAAGTEVTDGHTQSMLVPAGLFSKLIKDQQARPQGGELIPALQVILNVEPSSSTQMVGVARHDLYFLAADRPFWINFFKGAIAIWLGACLVLGIAVMASTYLSGIVTLIATLVLCAFGLILDYIKKLAEGRGQEDFGPAEAFLRLAAHKPAAVPLNKQEAGVWFAGLLDDSFRFGLRNVMKAFPDVSNYGLGSYVAEGFDISWGQVLFLNSVLPLVGYLLCWAVLGYYLIKWREIANPT